MIIKTSSMTTTTITMITMITMQIKLLVTDHSKYHYMMLHNNSIVDWSARDLLLYDGSSNINDDVRSEDFNGPVSDYQ